jgi:hypothetical protein
VVVEVGIVCRLLGALLVVVVLLPGPAEAQAGCQFKLGFRALHDLIPERVGDCTDDESHNPANGDGLQHTTAWHGKGGLLVWRKADNWTAFTDGATTWINGPLGVQSRPNSGPLFSWEAPAGGPASPPAAPPPLPGGPAAPSAGPRLLAVQGGQPGQTASVVVETQANSLCVLEYVTPSAGGPGQRTGILGTVSQGRGVATHVADASGRVSWSWLIGADTQPGTGTITVTCRGQRVSSPIRIG